MSSDRRQARVLAMQLLCQWEVQGDSVQDTTEFPVDEPLAPRVRQYVTRITARFWSRREAIDQLIGSVAKNWSLERMSVVERNVLRVAVVEMTEGLVPPKVSITEAIEIANDFGGADSRRFVNGLLDEILKREGIREEAAELPAPDGEEG